MNGSFTSRISVFVLIALIMGGFPNYIIQEAYAATPTITAITGAVGGNSTATTSIVVTFSEGVNGTNTGDTAAAWAVAGNTVTEVTGLLSGNSGCNAGSGGTLTMTITLGTAIATDATPQVTYDGDQSGAQNITIRSCNGGQPLVNATDSIITPVDGLRPVASSAATTDSTTIVITMSEDVTNVGAVAGDFAVTGVASSPSVSSISIFF